MRRHPPTFPGKRCEDWDLDDPAGQSIAAVRTIRDGIQDRVESWSRTRRGRRVAFLADGARSEA